MEKFFEHNFNIDKIILALYIPLGQGERIHPNRASHGLALHTSGIRDYIFSRGKTIRTEKNDVIFMPEHSDYIVETRRAGDCYAINFKIPEEVIFEPFAINMGALVTDKFKSAEKAFRLKTAGYEMRCKAELYSIICAMLGEYEKKYIPKSTEKIIEPAIEYIHRNYTSENISVEYLASLCGIGIRESNPMWFKNGNFA